MPHEEAAVSIPLDIGVPSTSLAIPDLLPAIFDSLPVARSGEFLPFTPWAHSLLPRQGFLQSPEGFGDSRVCPGWISKPQAPGMAKGGQGDEEKEMNSSKTFS